MTDSIMWDTTFDDPIYINGIQVGGNVVHDGCRWRVDILYGWNDTQDFNQQSVYSQTLNGPAWLNFQGKGKVLTLSGNIAAATRTTAQAAYSLLVQAIPENQVIQLRRTGATDQVMFVRLGGPITLTEDMGSGFRYAMTFVADDTLKYSYTEEMDTSGVEASGLYGFQLPLKLPLKLQLTPLTQFVETRRNYAWNSSPNVSTSIWATWTSNVSAWTASNPTFSGAIDNIPTGGHTYRVTAPAVNMDGGINYQLGLSAGQVDSSFWTAGNAYTASMYVRSNSGFNAKSFNIGVGARATVGSPNILVSSKNFTMSTSWQRVSLTFTVPTGVTVGWAQIYTNQFSNAISDWFEVTGLLIEKTAILQPYFDGSGYGANWIGTAWASDSVILSSVPITSPPLKYQMNFYNSGDVTAYPVSVVNGPLPAGWALQNLTTGEYLQFNYPLVDATSVVTIDHREQTALVSGGYPIDYTANGTWWGIEPGNNLLQLHSSVYSSIAAWACTSRSAWR